MNDELKQDKQKEEVTDDAANKEEEEDDEGKEKEEEGELDRSGCASVGIGHLHHHLEIVSR